MSSISTLETVQLRDILPPSIADDDRLTATADALDVENRAIVSSVETNLPYLPNLDNLASRIVDLLAWQYHVDNYDASESIASRRAQVRQAIADHRIYGTRAAVEKAADKYIGIGEHTIVEWWETAPVGPIYTYRIKFHGLPFGLHKTSMMPWTLIPESAITQLLTVLAVVSNVRSRLLGYLTWNEVDALNWNWGWLDLIGLTWDQMDDYSLNVVIPTS